MSRLLPRITLTLMSLTLACHAALAGEVGQSKSFKGPTGLQLYSLRDMAEKEGVLAMLDKTKALGFKYVEVAGLGKLTPAAFKKELDARGLIPIGSHFPYERLRDDIEGVARDAKDLGLLYVGCAWISHKAPFDEKQCRETAAVFNKAGEALAKHNLKFYYHNHGFEFQPFGQGTLFDLLMAETNPKYVSFQLDVLWTVFPGQDPAKLIEKYPNRWLLLHLKDLKKGVATGGLTGSTDTKNDVALGTGQVNWPALFQAAQKAGVKYYFIEDESPTVLDQIPQSLKFLESIEW